jgi:archaellum component FlaF (FlaF/FlaG flagellin family)
MGSSVISVFNTLVILCILVTVGILYSKYKDKIAGLMSAGKMYIDNKDKYIVG